MEAMLVGLVVCVVALGGGGGGGVAAQETKAALSGVDGVDLSDLIDALEAQNLFGDLDAASESVERFSTALKSIPAVPQLHARSVA